MHRLHSSRTFFPLKPHSMRWRTEPPGQYLEKTAGTSENSNAHLTVGSVSRRKLVSQWFQRGRRTIDLLLCVVYPVDRSPLLEPMGLETECLFHRLDVTLKYAMNRVTQDVCATIFKAIGAMDSDASAIRIYAIAYRSRRVDLLQHAARRTLRRRVSGVCCPVLRYIPVGAHIRLVDYHPRAVKVVLTQFETEVYDSEFAVPSSLGSMQCYAAFSNTPTCCTARGSTPHWWCRFSHGAANVLSASPASRD